MNLSDEVEIIFVDDGSNPPLSGEMKNLSWYYTDDKRPWTQGLARNLGASKAQGEYLFFTDIDHIITKEAIDDVLKFTEDKMVFPRYYGILGEEGDIVSDEKSMLEFGLDSSRLRTRRGYMCGGFHGNTYAIKREIFYQIGGYDPRYCQSMFHVGGRYQSEESKFNSRYHHVGAKWQKIGSKIYFYPVGRFRTDGDNNPFGLFHGLSLEQGKPLPMKD
jgi:hypothetical protein